MKTRKTQDYVIYSNEGEDENTSIKIRAKSINEAIAKASKLDKNFCYENNKTLFRIYYENNHSVLMKV